MADSDDVPSSQSRQAVATVDMLRQVGVSDPVVREFLEGKGVSAEEMRLVEGWKARHLSDKAFVEKYLAGGAEEKRLMTTANMVIAAGIREEKSA